MLIFKLSFSNNDNDGLHQIMQLLSSLIIASIGTGTVASSFNTTQI